MGKWVNGVMGKWVNGVMGEGVRLLPCLRDAVREGYARRAEG